MRLKSRGHLVSVHTLSGLQKLLPFCRSYGVPYRVLGYGSNQLLPPSYEGIYIKLDFPFPGEALQERHSRYTLPASVSLTALTSHALRHGLGGWEVLAGIPGTLGGALVMNAGTRAGEIGSLVESVCVVTPRGHLREERLSPSSFGHRVNHFLKEGEVVSGAVLTHKGKDPLVSQKIKETLRLRKASQPLKVPTCGCMFKNPVSGKGLSGGPFA